MLNMYVTYPKETIHASLTNLMLMDFMLEQANVQSMDIL